MITGHMMSSPRALLSVYDKTGIVEFAKSLIKCNWEIISTGGTAKLLREHDIPVMDVSEVTNHPEIFDGRVKSLHPAIHGPILARRENSEDRKGLEDLGYKGIDLVAVNLYPFSDAASIRPPLADSELLEMIDIGGPTLIRASAKNNKNVIVISNPSKYKEISLLLEKGKGGPEDISNDFRKSLAIQAFNHTACYDIAISKELNKRWIGDICEEIDNEDRVELLPHFFLNSAIKSQIMRYGENPHQLAAFYAEPDAENVSLAKFKQHGGKPLSYNNYVDLDAALRLARSLSSDDWIDTPHACIIVKHNNPCGAALSKTQVGAWIDALASDPESAFGCIVAFNETVTMEVVEKIGDHFLECIVAPNYADGVIEKLNEKKNRRVLSFPNIGNRLPALDVNLAAKMVSGGWVVQTEEAPLIDWQKAKVVTKIQPTDDEIASMKFGIKVCEQVKSNSIVFVKGTKTIGIGPGQTSRVEAVRIAARRAGDDAKNAIMVSDAFFPFRDGIDTASEIGIRSVVQPGGSIRDEDVIAAADEHGMSMLFTGVRLFRH